jgi:hypothetical protein
VPTLLPGPETHRNERSVTKGQYLIGAPVAAPVAKSAPLPPDLEHFAGVVEAAGPLGAPGLDEIEQRLAAARKRLEELRAAVRRK